MTITAMQILYFMHCGGGGVLGLAAELQGRAWQLTWRGRPVLWLVPLELWREEAQHD